MQCVKQRHMQPEIGFEQYAQAKAVWCIENPFHPTQLEVYYWIDIFIQICKRFVSTYVRAIFLKSEIYPNASFLVLYFCKCGTKDSYTLQDHNM